MISDLVEALAPGLVSGVVAAGVCACLMPIAIRVSHRFEWYDRVDHRKVHTESTPRIGGAVIFLSLVVAVGVRWLLVPTSLGAVESVPSGWPWVLAGLAAVVGLGLVDDLFGLAPRVKLGGQIVAAVLIGRGGLVIDRVTVPLSWVGIDLGAFALPLTVVWIVVVANSLNLIDGLDGLAGGTTAVVAVAYAILGILADSGIMVLVSLALLGSVVGFLFFNYPPARIFMGDSGSLLLGTLLAIIPFVPTPTTAPWQPVALAVSMMCLLVPLMDTVIAVVRRLLNRCAIHVADRNHIHHVLLAVGFSPKQVLLVFCLGTGVAAAVALSFGFVHPAAAFTLFLVVCVSAATGVFVLYRVKARAVSVETV